MTLLKDDGTIPISITKVDIINRPEINVRDGWNFGIGFGLALIIAIPVILLLSYFIVAFVLALLGGLPWL
jgi:hypothetical protein